MEYRIEQSADDITVFKNDQQFLLVKRKTGWTGKLYSCFYLNEELILKVTQGGLLRKTYDIEYQHLPQPLDAVTTEWLRSIGYYADKRIHIKTFLFKNPLYLLYENGQQVGGVTREFFSIDKNPVVFIMFFETESEANFNLLLLFLICLDPFMA